MSYTTRDIPRIHLDEAASTNDFCKQMELGQAAPLTLVTTSYQTAGRGAGANHWESEKGKNLLFSLMAAPDWDLPASRSFQMLECAALAVCEGLARQKARFTIKWPNDIYHKDRKVAGMLIENDLVGPYIRRSIIGVGVNVNQTLFRSDAPNPCSLAQIKGREMDADPLMDDILHCFLPYYERLRLGDYDYLHRRFLRHLYGRGKRMMFSDAQGVFEGKIVDVLPRGQLIILDTKGRERAYAFKEVEFLLKKGIRSFGDLREKH